jgi:energy-coupling factor transport system permease protein
VLPLKNKKKDAFGSCHPIVNFYYFVLVILCSMFFLHPTVMMLSFLGALSYAVYLKGEKAVRFTIFGMLPIFLVAAIFNPLFSHAGITILFYFPNGNPATVESMLYGLAMGGMLVTVITWFSCFNVVMTSDKLTYLFGKLIPSLSLVFSMTLRLVPRFKAQIREIARAQTCMGKGITDGNMWVRSRNGMIIISILLTSALENSIETATSMNARGFGLPGRTHFFNFRFAKRDLWLLAMLVGYTVVIFIGISLNLMSMQYFPKLIMAPTTVVSTLMYLMFFIVQCMPLILNIWEDIKWKSIESKL